MSDVWANVRDHGTAHLVMPSQLLTGQAALCGFEPEAGADWWLAEGEHARPSSSHCRKCAAVARHEAVKP